LGRVCRQPRRMNSRLGAAYMFIPFLGYAYLARASAQRLITPQTGKPWIQTVLSYER
jgi:hypothetical protein